MRNELKETWASGGTTIGSWISLPDGLSAGIASRSGLDYVCLDQQHGLIDRSAMPGLLRAIELGAATPLVRVQINAADSIELVVAACQNAGVVPGCHTTADLVDRRLEQGFRMITAVADTSLLKQGFADAAKRFGRASGQSGSVTGY